MDRPKDGFEFLENLKKLREASESNSEEIRELVSKLVSTYHPAQPEVTVVRDAKYVALTMPEQEKAQG